MPSLPKPLSRARWSTAVYGAARSGLGATSCTQDTPCLAQSHPYVPMDAKNCSAILPYKHAWNDHRHPCSPEIVRSLSLEQTDACTSGTSWRMIPSRSSSHKSQTQDYLRGNSSTSTRSGSQQTVFFNTLPRIPVCFPTRLTLRFLSLLWVAQFS